jgi:toxin secretion/phage lysis holin
MRAAANAAIAAIGAGAGYFFGGWDGFLYALVLLTVTDYLTGVASAAVSKTLSSDAGLRGVLKKALMFVLVGVAHTLDAYVLGGNAPVRNAVIFFFISNEGLSILENAASAGLPIPPKLKDLLAQTRDSGGGAS